MLTSPHELGTVLYTVTVPMAPQFATRLQQILETEGRKQAWLADQTGIDRARMSQYVNGILRPGDANRAKIADALGRSDEAASLFLPVVDSDH